MNKSSILGLVCALCLGQSAFAQNNQEIQYVEDPAQGYTFNRFQDNWFISAEGGANLLFSHLDSERKLADRFAPTAGIWVGKWFSPIIGLRAGVNWARIKGVGEDGSYGQATLDPTIKGRYYKTKHNDFTPMVDVMLNLTNWWCGSDILASGARSPDAPSEPCWNTTGRMSLLKKSMRRCTVLSCTPELP